MMCGTSACGSDEATLGDYLAFLAGDEDFELTVYGVRKTKAATERDRREREHNLKMCVAQRETKCAELETALATARATALRQADAARNAPGGLQGVAAQTALTAARVALMQVARIEVHLRHAYTNLEAGRTAIENIRVRTATEDDQIYYEAIRTALDEARIPHEQLAQLESISKATVRQFASLDTQNMQYNTILDAQSGALIQSNANVGQGRFSQYNLADTDSLLSALDSLRADSHHVSTALSVLDALPMPAHTATTTPTHRHDSSRLAQ